MNRVTAALLVVTLLAGCTSNQGEDVMDSPDRMTGPSSTESRPNDTSGSETNSTVVASAPAPVNNTLVMGNCTGFFADANVPAATVNTAAPGGWDQPHPTVEINLQVMECERVAIGAFERGPVRVLIEWHDNVEPPASCQEGQFDDRVVLSALWLSDAELAQFLATYGMPTQVATIEQDVVGGGGSPVNQWTFTVTGGGQSSVAMVKPTPYLEGGLNLFQRWYWENSVGGVSFLDWDNFGAGNEAALDVTEGTITSPLILASTGVESHVLRVEDLSLFEGTGPISQFRDAECQELF